MLKMAIVGAVILGVVSLYAALKISRAQIVHLKAEVYAAKNYQRITQENLDACLEANASWEAQGAAWNAATARMEQEATSYRERLQGGRERRLAAIARLSDLEAEVSSQITSKDCPEAVSQFVTALGWGTP